MNYLQALELENANLRRLIALLIVQQGGIVYLSEVDQVTFWDNHEAVSYINKSTGEWILEVRDVQKGRDVF